jgi:hypothetical protein
MTDEQIRHITRRVWGESAILPWPQIEEFARKIAELEREECFNIVDESFCHDPMGAKALIDCAEAIRSKK